MRIATAALLALTASVALASSANAQVTIGTGATIKSGGWTISWQGQSGTAPRARRSWRRSRRRSVPRPA